MNNQLVLCHHGIKGQRWGVRRYQNEDGSYTKAGLARYNKAANELKIADENATNAKAAYKAGTGSKEAYRKADLERVIAKKKESDAYKYLKNANYIDQGEKLHLKGKTVGKEIAAIAGTGIGSLAVSLGAMALVNKYTDSGSWANIIGSGAATLGGLFVTGIVGAKIDNENTKLNAYYNAQK